MTVSIGLARVQHRIAELQALQTAAAAPLVNPAATPPRFSELLAAKLSSGAVDASAPTTATTATGAPAAPAWAMRSAAAAARVDSAQPPWATYENGRIPLEAMDPIGRGAHRLWGPAAASFRQLLADAERAGIRIGVTDSYRTHDQQVDLARRKGLYSEGGLAAKPGTSQHGWGLAVDLALDAAAQSWMRRNAGRYGFVEDTPREPWHWAYKGV